MSKLPTRLSRNISGFNADIRQTSTYIQQPTSVLIAIINGIRLGWTPEEIAQWLAFLAAWIPLYLLYSNKKGTRTTAITEELKKIISKAVAYDKAHHLYDRIADNPNATALDFETFHIKRSTFLAASPKKAEAPGLKKVVISMKKVGHLFHHLSVTSPDKKGKGKEEGVKDIMMYRAIRERGAEAPALKTFEYFDDVKYGSVLSKLSEDDVGNEAGYYARIKNTHNELGIPSEVVWFMIM
ncbi:MAG: hypothetical protein WCH34_08530 [Bacteroidota bacterium]